MIPLRLPVSLLALAIAAGATLLGLYAITCDVASFGVVSALIAGLSVLLALLVALAP